jgi:hypothetical protein
MRQGDQRSFFESPPHSSLCSSIRSKLALWCVLLRHFQIPKLAFLDLEETLNPAPRGVSRFWGLS